MESIMLLIFNDNIHLFKTLRQDFANLPQPYGNYAGKCRVDKGLQPSHFDAPSARAPAMKLLDSLPSHTRGL